MKITSIQATALKGKTFAHAIAPLTMLCGANDVGKTSVANAIQLLLLGHIPQLGKTNAATAALASGPEMTVRAVVDGKEYFRRWKRTGRGKAQRVALDGNVDLGETPLALLNAEEYFGKSEKARIDMIFGLMRIDATEFLPTEIRGRIRASVLSAPSGAGEVPEALFPPLDQSAEEWLTELSGRLDDAISDANAEAKRMQSTVAGIAQMQIADPIVSADEIERLSSELEQRITGLTTEVERIRGKIAAREKESERFLRLKAEHSRIMSKIAGVALPDRESQAQIIGDSENEIIRLRSGYAAAAATWQAEAEKRARLGRLRESIRAMKAEIRESFRASAIVQEEIDGFPKFDPVQTAQQNARLEEQNKGYVAALRKNEEARKYLLATYEEQQRLKECPCCGIAGMSWQERLRNRFDLDTGKLQVEAKELSDAFDALADSVKAGIEAHNQALDLERKWQALNRELGNSKALEAEEKNLQRRIQQAEKEAEEIVLSEAVEPVPVAEKIRGLENRIANLREGITLLDESEKAQKLEQEMQGIDAPDNSLESRLAETHGALDAEVEKRAGITAKRQRAQNNAADERRKAQATNEYEALLIRIEILKLARVEMNQEREKLIRIAFGPMLKVANLFTDGILPTPLEYRDGEIGRFQQESWIPVRAFGGTHGAVTYAGINAALGAQAPARIVIMDEMGRFDADNKRKFLENVRFAIAAGTIEQFVGIDVEADPYRDLGVALIEVRA